MRQASYKSNAKTTCRTRRPALPHIVIPAKAGTQRGVARGVSSPFAPPTPVVGALPESVRPEPVEASPEGTRRGPFATSNPRITPHTLIPPAAQHPDTSSLPQRRRPRYHPRMEAQTNDACHPIDVSAHIEVFVARSSRATGNARLARQVRGLFRQKNGFVAAMCHGPYGTTTKQLPRRLRNRGHFSREAPVPQATLGSPGRCGNCFARKNGSVAAIGHGPYGTTTKQLPRRLRNRGHFSTGPWALPAQLAVGADPYPTTLVAACVPAMRP